MRTLLTTLSAIVLLAYPFAVYFGIDKFGFETIAALLGGLFVIRILFGSNAKLKVLKYLTMLSGTVGLSLVLLGWFFRQHGLLMYYPVVVNLCMLFVFAASLKQPQTIIERLARIQEPDLPKSGILYTRKVTVIWCAFFLLNASVALYTCFQSMEVWTLYNGLISYLLAGGLLASEWVVRQFIRKE